MELTFRKLEACVPPPRWTVLGKVRVARYSERTIQQAIVQKLARAISALNASEVLIRAGLTIDHGAFHRIVDENNEDVAFLSLGIIKKDITALHKRFLDGFYAEDFSDPENVGATTKGRDIVKRRSIFHYVQTAFDTGFNLEVWNDPDFPDTEVKYDDLGGTGWEGDHLRRSSSTRRSSWFANEV
jgi:hypothetical protein